MPLRPPMPRAAVPVALALALSLVSASCTSGSSDTTAPGSSEPATGSSSPATSAGTAPTADTHSPTVPPSTAGSSEPTTTTGSTGGGGPIHSIDFDTTTLPADSCGAVFPAPPADGYHLLDGEIRHGTPADVDFYAVSVRPPVFGDVTGDGQDEAVVVVDCATGTHPIPFVWVFTADGSTLRRLGARSLDDVAKTTLAASAVTFDSAAIHDGVVDGRWRILRAGDQPCCPSRLMGVGLRWDGTSFVAAGAAEI